MQSPEFDPTVGKPLHLARGLRLVLAPNASPMTHLGTNTFLLGDTKLCIIDPGPDSDAHLEALIVAIGAATVSHIIVTHNHLDHSPLAKRLSETTGARIYAYGNHFAGRSPIMAGLAAQGLAGGGEGIDSDFAPDVALADGEIITTPDWTLTVSHTPGHIGNHISLIWGDTVFSGDHVMGWASSLVSPPDGDLTDFMTSCHKLRSLNARILYPAHGAPITSPNARIDWLISHRLAREAQVIDCLSKGARTAPEITDMIYTEIAPALLPAAQRNVFAHLVDLAQRGKVTAIPHLSISAKFTLAQENEKTGKKP